MRPDPQAGDVLLYWGTGFFSWAIRMRTYHVGRHDPVHVEVAIGDGESVASRNGIGVNRYPLRTDGLAYVLRPTVPFRRGDALDWFVRHAQGKRYGWLELLSFYGIHASDGGMFCSQFATSFLRAGGVPIFNQEQPQLVPPCEFRNSELLREIWSLDAAPAAEG